MFGLALEKASVGRKRDRMRILDMTRDRFQKRPENGSIIILQNMRFRENQGDPASNSGLLKRREKIAESLLIELELAGFFAEESFHQFCLLGLEF